MGKKRTIANKDKRYIADNYLLVSDKMMANKLGVDTAQVKSTRRELGLYRLFPGNLEMTKVDVHALLVALLCGLVILIAVTHQVAPIISAGDSGDLTAAAYSLGVPHPTGYPTYIMLSKLFTLLVPLGNIGFRCGVLSTVFAAIAVILMMLACYRLTSSLIIPVFFSLLIGLGPVFVSQSVLAEVYTFHLVLLMLVFHAFLSYLGDANLRRLFILFFLCGLSLTNHLTSIFFVLAILVVLVIYHRRQMLKGDAWLVAIGFILLAISIYIYLPLRGSRVELASWGHIKTISQALDHVLGKVYQHKMVPEPKTIIQNLWLFFHHSCREILYFGWLLALVGFYALYRRKKQLFVFCSVFIISSIIHIINYNIIDIQAYYLPTFMLLGLLICIGLAGISRYLSVRFPMSKAPVAYTVYAILVLAIPLASYLSSFYENDKSNNFIAYDYGRNILITPEQGIVLFCMGDNQVFPLIYLQTAEAWRPDIRVFHRGGYLFEDIYNLEDANINRDALQRRVEKDYIGRLGNRVYFTDETDLSMLDNFELIAEGLIFRAWQINKLYKPRLDFWKAYSMRGLEDDAVYKKDYLTSYIATKVQWRHARYLADTGKIDSAMLQYEMAAQSGENIGKAQYNLGLMYEQQGDFSKAVKYYKKAIELEPDLEQPYLNLGLLYEKLGNLNDAYRLYGQGLASNPNSYELNMRLGYAAERRGDWRKAADAYEQAVRLSPHSADAHNNLGVALAANNRNQEALKHLQVALQIEPDSSKSLNNLGVIYNTINQPKKAIPYLQKAIDLDPDYAEAYSNLALAHLLLRQYSDATYYYEKSLNLNPDLTRSIYNLGYIYIYHTSEMDKGLRLWRRYLELEPNSPQAHSIRSELSRLGG